MQVKHDRKLLIAIGRSRKASQWQNKEMMWSEFLDKLATTTRTRETVTDYAAMSKADRDTVKDVGGFVGGYLKNGRRNNASVANRLHAVPGRRQCGSGPDGRSGHDVY